MAGMGATWPKADWRMCSQKFEPDILVCIVAWRRMARRRSRIDRSALPDYAIDYVPSRSATRWRATVTR
jgi:hypothetical protein